MDPKVKEFIEKQEKIKEKQLSAEKKELALELGLYNKVYSAKPKYSDEYPEYEYDSDAGEARYYKKVPIDMTEEEYNELIKYCKTVQTNEKNIISTVFKVLAYILFAGGFFVGFIMAAKTTGSGYNSETGFSFATALIYWGISFISGMLFLGIAEVIQLLNDIKNK